MYQLSVTNIEKYNHKITIVLLVDPYNDFIASDGKLYPYAKEVLEEVYLLNHLKEIIEKARQVGIQIFYVPHHRWVPGDYSKWSHPNPNQINSVRAITFEKDTWGGAFHDDFQSQEGDIIIKEHWAQSGFMHAAHELNGRTFAHAILSTDELNLINQG